ncbi:MAG TPA: PLP-dependent aminotransferase family protein [Tepidisphaeraceae bacterium]|nr:PLP-dependent aminotransferase family protein [Tepidisphaeraceae bacterium]
MLQKNDNLAKELALSAKAARTKEQPISYLIQVVINNPTIINLAAGLVDPLTLPVEEVKSITHRIFSDTARGQTVLQYDTTQGLADLRKAVLAHMEKLEGMPAAKMGLSADDLMITNGSQQALYLIGDVLIDPGDIVIAANPSYFVYTGALSSLGAKVIAAPTDENGMDVDAVEQILQRLERSGEIARVKMIYCTSYFDNPTGLTLSTPRRKKLVELAKRFSTAHRIMILEDAAYRELRYDGEALPSIKSFVPENKYTIISLTFSKPFAPGIKLGYSAMPLDLLHACLQQKGNHDFGSANLSQHVALETLRDGSYYKHVEVLKQSYRVKRDAVLAALDKHMPKHPQISWTRTNGGLYVWITLPDFFDTSRSAHMFQSCLHTGVIYVPGEYCYQPDENGRIPTNHLRLSFGAVPIEKIEPGIEKLAHVVKEYLEGNAAPKPVAKAGSGV